MVAKFYKGFSLSFFSLRHKSKKTIVFAVNIKHANLLTEAYKKAGFSCEVLHSETKKQNDEIVNRFKKGYVKVLVSVNMLTTGFDVPDTDMAVIARPTKSQNLYKQMVGRIMRLAPDKTHAILLDCGGVVRNLGYPTDPIKEHVKSDRGNGKHLCSFCGSQRLHPKNINEKIYWVCSECGEKKEAKEARIYRCESCSTYSGRNANLYMDDKSLTLICQCGHHTVISTPHCDEVLTPVIDPKRKIEIITNRVIREYKELIEKHFGNKELNTYEIKNHIRDIEHKIKRDPDNFLELDLDTVINQDNRFISFVKDEKDAFFKNMRLSAKEIEEAEKKLHISTITLMDDFNKHYLANPENIDNIYEELENIILNFQNENYHYEKELLILNKLLYELHFLQSWQDFFILLPKETLFAITRLFQILYSNDFAKNNPDFQQQLIESYKKYFYDLYNNTFKKSINFSKKISIKTIEKNYEFIEPLHENIMQIIKLFYSKLLKYDVEDLEELLDEDNWETFCTTKEMLIRSERLKEFLATKKTENENDKKEAIIVLNEYIGQEGRFIKNPEIAMQFVTLFIKEYDAINLEINHVFSDINARITQITDTSKIKKEHQTLLLQLNEKIFSFKKFNLWHDSFFHLSYENFEAILGLFTLLGENLKKSINKYVYDNNEIDAKTLAIYMRSELHNIENIVYEVWERNHPIDQTTNLLKNSKKFRQLFNERMTNKIADFEKILS